MKKKVSDKTESCDKCNTNMKIIEQYVRLMDQDEVGDLSEGEEAEYMAAECGGDESGEFSFTVVTYECPNCHNKKIVESR